MKTWKKIKLILYILISVSIAIFMDTYMSYLHLFIGFIISMYGLETIIINTVSKEKDIRELLKGVIELILAIMIIAFRVNFEDVCIVWAVWALLREADEVSEYIHLIKEKKFVYVSLAESIVSTFFAITLLLNQSEHHVSIHMYLLIVEMVSTVIFPIFRDKIIKKKEVI